jgi:CTP:molybdopterin cytidylyltransferase MocA
MNIRHGFTALVLAGDRHANDSVALDAGVPCKALAPVAGTPMILRVIHALENCGLVDRIILIGPAVLQGCAAVDELIRAGRVERIPNLNGPSASAVAGLKSLAPDTRVLLTTADHALLRSDIVADFLHGAGNQDVDVVAGVVKYEHVRAALPEVKRTVIRLADGQFCGCNLFAFLTPGGRKMAEFWVEVERSRKKPARLIVQLLGLRGILAYLIGKLTLHAALARLSKRTGVRLGTVEVTAPHAAVDVDTPADRALAEQLLSRDGISPMGVDSPSI